MSLLELMQKHKTDKAGHRYDIPYGVFFNHRTETVKKVLEIGVKKGASLRLWEEYFPKAQIFGIDINSASRSAESARSKVFIGSQTNRDFLASVIQQTGPDIDLIVDDGAHLSDAQVISMDCLWKALSPNFGVYAVEDLHAHLKLSGPKKKFDNSRCKYPPLGDMIGRRINSYFKLAACSDTNPGICCFPCMVLFIKTGDVPAPRFEHLMKKGK